MRLFITLFYSLLLFCILFSCRDESSSIGAKWVDSSFMNAVTDTCTVTLSTLLSDSLATSGDTVCQIGRYKDNLYGEIKTSFYAEYEVPSHSLNETTEYQFDSITFKWYSSGNYLGDTLVYHRIELFSLSQGISLEDDGYLLIRPMLIITGIIFLLLFLYVLLPDTVTRCMNYVCLTNGEKNGLI